MKIEYVGKSNDDGYVFLHNGAKVILDGWRKGLRLSYTKGGKIVYDTLFIKAFARAIPQEVYIKGLLTQNVTDLQIRRWKLR